MKRFDLFGWQHRELSELAQLIQGALGVEFALHDSGYLGGEYYRSLGLEGDEIIVQPNVEDEEGYLTEVDFPDFRTLVYVNGSSEEVARALGTIEGLDLLRSEEI